jgi:hypothetical protein
MPILLLLPVLIAASSLIAVLPGIAAARRPAGPHLAVRMTNQLQAPARAGERHGRHALLGLHQANAPETGLRAAGAPVIARPDALTPRRSQGIRCLPPGRPTSRVAPLRPPPGTSARTQQEPPSTLRTFAEPHSHKDSILHSAR